MTLSDKDKRAIRIGAIALGIILVARFLLIPWMDSWFDARRRIATADEQLERLQKPIRRALGLQKHLERLYGPGVNRPCQDIEAAKLSLMKVAGQLAKFGGMQPSSNVPQRGRSLANVPGVEIVLLQIRGKCDFPQFSKTLAALMKSETLVFVERLSLTNDQKKPGQLDVTLVLATLAERGEVKP